MSKLKKSLLALGAAAAVTGMVAAVPSNAIAASHNPCGPKANNPCKPNPCAANPCKPNPCKPNPCQANPCKPNPCKPK